MEPAVVFVAFQTRSHANGGLESLTYILRGMPGRRVVITQTEGPFTARWRALGCEVHILPAPEPRALSGLRLASYRLQRVPGIARSNLAAAAIVREVGARIVHCNDASAFWYAGIGAALGGARVVLNVRDTRPNRDYGAKWRALRHLAGTMVVLSEEMRAELEHELRPLVRLPRAADIISIHSAVDLGRMTRPSAAERLALRSRLGLGDEVFAMVYVGTFNDKKNQLDFLERAAPALVKDEQSSLIFVGDFRPAVDEYAARCQAAVERLGLSSKVRFEGFTRSPEDWYRAADVICLASRNEGLARAMIEAMACGTPVVSFDVSSAREVLEQRGCGEVVPQGDYPAFVRAVGVLRSDPARRASYGSRAAEVARELFDPQRSVSRYRELYRRLELESRRSSSSA